MSDDHADEALDQHRAVADRPDVATRWSIIFGVVPDAISAWKPEIAPQAIVMNTNGKSVPGMIGPPPPANCVTAGICSSG